jgi:hypothetical protein
MPEPPSQAHVVLQFLLIVVGVALGLWALYQLAAVVFVHLAINIAHGSAHTGAQVPLSLAGMLFVYDSTQPGNAGFWMYRTRIPLDIAFVCRTLHQPTGQLGIISFTC